MNNAHLHLVVNHLPIVFPVVGIIILLIGIITKSDVSKRNAYLIFILGAIASVLAMATGEGAEEAVEHVDGISENLIKTHGEAAELFAGFSYVVGVVSAAALFAGLRKFKFSGIFAPIILFLSVVMMYFAQQAGRTGGEIRHTEIRSGSATANGSDNRQENGAERPGAGEADED